MYTVFSSLFLYSCYSSSSWSEKTTSDLRRHLIGLFYIIKHKLSFKKLTLLSAFRNTFVVGQVIADVIFLRIFGIMIRILSASFLQILWLQHFCELDLVVFMWYNLWHLILSFLAIWQNNIVIGKNKAIK